jgi:tRNA pseudouridine13 synthase
VSDSVSPTSIASASATSESSHIASLAYAWGRPLATARLRQSANDFQVDEQLGFDLSGAGEHAFVQIRKQQLNTEQVARQLARLAQVKARDVSFSGMKDRNAVTTQWFSVHLPGMPEPDWSVLNSEQMQVLQQGRHRQKLRRGSHRANRFVIILREVLLDVQGEHAQLDQRLQTIAQHGVPNYFGPQRFGNGEANIARAIAMLSGQLRVKDRHQRSLYLSTARALLFNKVLSRRVEQGNWNCALPGDAMMLQGSHSFFVAEEIDSEIEQRLAQHDIHPSGPLWGRGALATQAETRDLELAVLEDDTALCAGLEQAGLSQERRALRLLTEDLHWQWLSDDALQLSFALPRGAYATSVIRECCVTEPS